MSQDGVTITIAILGFLLLWGGTVATVMIWLNTKFNALVPMQSYEERHMALDDRVKALELWRAAKNGVN